MFPPVSQQRSIYNTEYVHLILPYYPSVIIGLETLPDMLLRINRQDPIALDADPLPHRVMAEAVCSFAGFNP